MGTQPACRGCPFLISTEVPNDWEGHLLPFPVSYPHDRPWRNGTGGDELCTALPAERPRFVSCNQYLVSGASFGTEAVPGCAKGLCVRISKRK